MRKTGYYSANDCDFLEEGEKLRLEHDLRFQPNDKILLPLVNASDFDLYELRALAVSGEKKVFEQLKELAEVWEQKAALTMLIDRALSYKRVPQVEHTSNQWQQSHYRDTEIVSNMVQRYGSIRFRCVDCHLGRQSEHAGRISYKENRGSGQKAFFRQGRCPKIHRGQEKGIRASFYGNIAANSRKIRG